MMETEPLLTPRQHDVVRASLRGLKIKDIGDAVGLTEKGVKWQLTRIFRKYGVRSRPEMIAKIYRNGWIK